MGVIDGDRWIEDNYCFACLREVATGHICGSRFRPCYTNAAQEDYVRSRNALHFATMRPKSFLCVAGLVMAHNQRKMLEGQP